MVRGIVDLSAGDKTMYLTRAVGGGGMLYLASVRLGELTSSLNFNTVLLSRGDRDCCRHRFSFPSALCLTPCTMTCMSDRKSGPF